MNNHSDLSEGLLLELRRGTIVLSVLSQLEKPQYGYHLLKSLQEYGLSVEPGTLYPLLRRLEKQGLLNSTWDTSDVRPRKYYSIKPEGKEVYKKLKLEWLSISYSIGKLINQGGPLDGAN